MPRRLVPLDPGQALGDAAEIAALAGEAGLPRLAALLSEAGPVRDFLAAAFDLSDFLRDHARRNPQALDRLFDVTVANRLAELNAAIAAAPLAGGVSETSLMADLRRLKAEAHFLIAPADPFRCLRKS